VTKTAVVRGRLRREHFFANRAAAEIDVYGGIRPTFGAFAFDIASGLPVSGRHLPIRRTGFDFAGNFQGTNAQPTP